MFAFISGILSDIEENNVIVENNGIGYAINSSLNTIRQLPQIGSEVKLNTKLIPKEDSLTLYGFFDKEELKMFELLLSVSGVGPKGALSILSSLSLSEIYISIAESDAKAFSKTPGVGKKTAERIIVDLKDKINVIATFESVVGVEISNKVVEQEISHSNAVKKEVVEALVSLGYSTSNAKKVLDNMPVTESVSSEQLLSDALKQLSFI